MLALLCALAFAGDASLPGDVGVDLHLDTPTQLHRRGVALDHPALEADLHDLRAGGITLAVEVLWPAPRTDGPAHLAALLGRMEREVAARDDVVRVSGPYAARVAAAEGRLGVVYGLEGAHGLGDDWRADLDALAARGLVVLGLVWSTSNRFAGSSGDGGGGLTDDGRALVARAGELGLVVDLSHASRATTLDVCRAATVPVIASHSDAFAVHPDARNLTDEEIRCIAATGGVIGLNLHAPFLGGARDLAAVADHADHLARVGGKAVVALGTDFDGMIVVAGGLGDASRLPALWHELRRRGWTDAEIAHARGEGFLRAWGAVLAARR